MQVWLFSALETAQKMCELPSFTGLVTHTASISHEESKGLGEAKLGLYRELYLQNDGTVLWCAL